MNPSWEKGSEIIVGVREELLNIIRGLKINIGREMLWI